jgi:hypothetical protein
MKRRRHPTKRKHSKPRKHHAQPSKLAKSAKRPKRQKTMSREKKPKRKKTPPVIQRRSPITKPARRSRKSAPAIGKRRHGRNASKTGLRRREYAAMRFFSDGKTVIAVVNRRNASAIGSYLAAVRRLLDTNDTEPLEQFAGQTAKDVRRNIYPLEIRPNVLYRLNATVEPFEEVYRLVA